MTMNMNTKKELVLAVAVMILISVPMRLFVRLAARNILALVIVT